ncbi:3'-5' exonuclease [Streptomyces sp. NPDC020298]|uniref:3'-5' exonuclease n=1 Tax=unclassified Streptomyces TaxID=2593676 RepID=UPI0033F86A5E
MSWHLGRLAGFDTETTGINVERDRIVTACVVQVGGNQPVAAANWLADPGVDIPEAAARVHGITTERARKEGRPAGEVVEQVVAALAAVVLSDIPVVAMNASFDFTILDREARRHGVQPLADIVGGDMRVVDPFVLDKRIDPYRRGKRTLTDLCRHYQVPLDGAHSADADAIAACRVAWRIASTHAEIGKVTLDELHDMQIVWAREQAESLADYFRRTPGKENRADSVRTEWPLIPAQRTEGQ